jgi:polyhydroxyalkanoate synthesis regulator phasin
VGTKESRREGGGVTESLRAAVERTIAATAGTAAETRGRAQDLLDEVARRGLEARDQVARGGTVARDEVARRGQRTREGLSGMRFASAQEVRALEKRLTALEERLEAFDAAFRAARAEKPNPRPQG